MKLQNLSTLLSLSVFTLASPVADKVPEARAGTTPTPTGSACPVVEADPTISVALSATELAVAVAGCVGVELQRADDTRNDIVDGECKPFTLIFARGTGEDPNLGNIVGPPFVVALDAVFGTSNVAVQGVNNYAADVLGFCEGGSATGATDLVQLIEQTQSQCPSTKLCVSGYSQGSQVVHDAAEQLSTSATNFINSVVLFGDPDQAYPVGNIPSYKVSKDCHMGDNICQGGENVLFPHLTYCHDVALEAAFAKARSFASD